MNRLYPAVLIALTPTYRLTPAALFPINCLRTKTLRLLLERYERSHIDLIKPLKLGNSLRSLAKSVRAIPKNNMARNRTPEQRREAKQKREARRKRHLAVTASGQKVAITDTGMILGLQSPTAAPLAAGWPRDSHTKIVMDFCETWGSGGLAAVMSPRQRFA